MRAALVLTCALLGVGCRTPALCVSCDIPDQAEVRSVGTRVPLSELEAARFDLRARVADELAAGRAERAYFVLDLLKTSPYGERQLVRPRMSDAPRDLRPLLGELSDVGPEQMVVGAARPLMAPPRALSADDAYWRYLGLFERRIGPLAVDTAGLPYSYAARRALGVSSAEETALMFSRDEAFVSYVVSGERVFGFVSSRGRLRVRQLAWSTAQLGAAVTRLRERVGDPPRRTDPDEWMRGAAALHDVLLGPFADELQRPDLHALFVSPDGAVAGVPFAALLEPHDGRRRPLIDRLVISYLPSATVYRGLMERRILEEPPRILAVADAVYPSTVHALPMAAEEGQVVSELFPDSLLLTGASATEAEVLARAPAYNILHFATHGLPGAGDASSLLLTQAGADDGLLSAAEVSALDLSHVYLAVLSACGSAVISQSDGSGLGSVVGAFVVAGVPSVVGSLWAIQERASTDLMVELYRRYLDHGAARALRAAMLKTRAVPGLSHPYYWAAFVAYGWDK